MQFAVTKQGYLVHVQMLIKVYPDLKDKIMFVGFLQHSSKYDLMPPPKQEQLINLEQEFIMCDSKGNISHVTEGLYRDMGLHPKFFITNSYQ